MIPICVLVDQRVRTPDIGYHLTMWFTFVFIRGLFSSVSHVDHDLFGDDFGGRVMGVHVTTKHIFELSEVELNALLPLQINIAVLRATTMETMQHIWIMRIHSGVTVKLVVHKRVTFLLFVSVASGSRIAISFCGDIAFWFLNPNILVFFEVFVYDCQLLRSCALRLVLR